MNLAYSHIKVPHQYLLGVMLEPSLVLIRIKFIVYSGELYLYC